MYFFWWEYNGERDSHVSICECLNGKARFIDPQTGDADASDIFDDPAVIKGSFKYGRIDDKEPSDLVKECCE